MADAVSVFYPPQVQSLYPTREQSVIGGQSLEDWLAQVRAALAAWEASQAGKDYRKLEGELDRCQRDCAAEKELLRLGYTEALLALQDQNAGLAAEVSGLTAQVADLTAQLALTRPPDGQPA